MIKYISMALDFVICLCLNVMKKENKVGKNEACSQTVSVISAASSSLLHECMNSPPFSEGATMTKCTRKAQWQKTKESYQCMNLITTQMAPHNEERWMYEGLA